jgi:hypothetical protein
MKQQFFNTVNRLRLAAKKTNYVPVTAGMLFLVCAIGYASCKKSYTQAKPDYVVLGVHTTTLVNTGGMIGTGNTISLALNVNYVAQSNAAQELVTLSVSGLPAGITMDTTWITTGYPSFATTLTLYDTTAAGASIGSYIVTLTVTGASTGKKTFPFTLKISNAPPCTSTIVGKYYNCYTICTGIPFTDSVYNDPTTPNKVWFANFNNTGSAVYGTLNCSTMQLTIPSQTIGGITYYANNINAYGHYISGYVYKGSTSCSLNMH